jgi:hypothetical protein
MARRLTDDERATFAFIHDEGTPVGLVQTEFDGEDTAVIAAFEDDGTSGTRVTPLAVLVTDAIMARLTDPSAEPVGHAPIPGQAQPAIAVTEDMLARVILASALINRDLDGEQEIPGLGEALARTLFGRLAELAGTPAAS